MLVVLPLNNQVFSGNFWFLHRQKFTFWLKRGLWNHLVTETYSFYRYYTNKPKCFHVEFKVWVRILSSSELATKNEGLSTGMETTPSFSQGKLLGWIQSKYFVFPALITYTEKLYHPKVVSFWKHYKNSAWQKQNLNVKNWKTGRSEIYEGNRSKDKIEYHRNWRVIKKLTKTLFHGTFFLNTGLSRTTMKNSLALLQKILKEVTYSSIF